MNKTLLSLALLGVLSGCSLIPDYQRPAAPIDDQWRTAEAGAQTQPMELGWREFFRDSALQRVVGLALENNRDLRVAALNVEAYRALYRVQRAELFPFVSADGSGQRTRTPGDLTQTGEPVIGSQYSATLGVSWELDLFGRLDSLREQALQQYFASDAARYATRLSLIASVANAWLTLQADQALLGLTRDTLETYEKSLALTQRSFDVGVASALELQQARSAVESARVALARYRRQVMQDRNALVQLVGAPIGSDLQPAELGENLLAELPVGLPSDLLYKRPDILQAEHELLAANANIGAARAAFFPSISLTGAAGSASAELSGLFDGGSGYWSFAPSISVPIFTAGQLRANLDYARLIKNAQVATYEGAIQTAFREVADALAARETYAEQVAAQRDLAETSAEYYRLAERRYRTGVESYLTLLDAQRQLFEAKQQLITDRLAQLTTEVGLYTALGGGWDVASTPLARTVRTDAPSD